MKLLSRVTNIAGSFTRLEIAVQKSQGELKKMDTEVAAEEALASSPCAVPGHARSMRAAGST